MILPGFPVMIAESDKSYTLVAGYNGIDRGYIDATLASYYSRSPVGSISKNTLASGHIIHSIRSGGSSNYLTVASAASGLTGIIIDGNLYSLSDSGAFGGFRDYTIVHGSAIFGTSGTHIIEFP